MATREIVVPVGSDLRDAAGFTWQIAGIQIDNPSGSWLRVVGVEQYVPPYTNGWSYPVNPSQTSISVLFVDSPSGSLSELVGDPVVVRLSDTPYPNSAGFPSGSGSKQATIPPSSTAIEPSIGTGAAVVMIPALDGHRTIIRRLAVIPDLSAGFATQEPFRSLMTVSFYPTNLGGGEWSLAISPETPFAEATFEDGTYVLDEGNGLEFTARAETGAAKAYYIAMAQYYREKVSQ